MSKRRLRPNEVMANAQRTAVIMLRRPVLVLSVVALIPRREQVTDEQGRRRFHGAFTGGFSAGYFNTVSAQLLRFYVLLVS